MSSKFIYFSPAEMGAEGDYFCPNPADPDERYNFCVETILAEPAMIRISDSLGRMVPFDMEEVGDLIEVLMASLNRWSMLNQAKDQAEKFAAVAEALADVDAVWDIPELEEEEVDIEDLN